MSHAKQPGGFHKVFSLAVVAYATLSLLFDLWVYAAATFRRLTYEPAVVACLFIGHIVLLYFVRMDWRQDLFEWRGLLAARGGAVAACRWILGLSVVAFVAQLGWLAVCARSPAWAADPRYKTALIVQTVASAQIVLGLLFLFLALFGSGAFTSKRFRRLGYSPVVETARWARQSSVRRRRRREMR